MGPGVRCEVPCRLLSVLLLPCRRSGRVRLWDAAGSADSAVGHCQGLARGHGSKGRLRANACHCATLVPAHQTEMSTSVIWKWEWGWCVQILCVRVSFPAPLPSISMAALLLIHLLMWFFSHQSFIQTHLYIHLMLTNTHAIEMIYCLVKRNMQNVLLKKTLKRCLKLNITNYKTIIKYCTHHSLTHTREGLASVIAKNIITLTLYFKEVHNSDWINASPVIWFLDGLPK